ncbi:MAG TPA: glutamate formimidoyltransferase [Vicinamibacterales bacterium]|nr:glutamate formimidoyltransferase [Vicinamibacterales bacterium]
MPMIECVPNVSEGRRPEIVEAIASAVAHTRGVRLLDVSSDAAHNRSVITLAGTATGVGDAVLTLFAAAVPRIDLRTHHGEHPRIGAVDVVPFVPLNDTPMAECVALARDTASIVAARFDLPVFLYEDAATAPHRRNLADVRRGQFEGLTARMARPEWRPDFGPSLPHPTAGAVAIGARPPLIAFNVNLATADVTIAKRIASIVRERDGGLPAVKALGLAVHDRHLAQVSMNLTDYRRTGMAEAFAAVARAARQFGTDVVESEIVGLLPRAALPPDATESLRLARFDTRQILEDRLGRAAHL